MEGNISVIVTNAPKNNEVVIDYSDFDNLPESIEGKNVYEHMSIGCEMIEEFNGRFIRIG